MLAEVQRLQSTQHRKQKLEQSHMLLRVRTTQKSIVKTCEERMKQEGKRMDIVRERTRDLTDKAKTREVLKLIYSQSSA